MAAKQKPTTKRLPKLSDAERHQRFVEMAHEVDASEDPKDFDKAFKTVIPELHNRNQSRRKRERE